MSNIKKVTPTHDLSWYVKWVSTILIIISVSIRAVSDGNSTMHLWDLMFGLTGTMGWTLVGVLWHDRSMILLNGIVAALLFGGIVNYLS